MVLNIFDSDGEPRVSLAVNQFGIPSFGLHDEGGSLLLYKDELGDQARLF